MLGAGLQFNRSRSGEDRFYSAAKARRSHSHSLNHSQHQNHNQDHFRRAQSDVGVGHSLKPESQVDSDGQTKIKKSVPAAPAAVEPSPLCNLERFLESITPSVPAQYLSKTTMRSWRTCDVEFQPFFVLGDLWESFKEWSAYGAGVPLVLNDSDSVVQYYVPYLSGIQLYGDPSKSSTKSSRRSGDESDVDYFRDSSSDGSSDGEPDRCWLNLPREQHSLHPSRHGNTLSIDRLSLVEENVAFHEGFSSDEGESLSCQRSLLFEYLERDPPFSREPLADKLSDLALRFPELKVLRSCDLLPSSWISVAWYPIYRIPMGPTLKALDACFLTFHYLHTPMTGSQGPNAAVVTYPKEMHGDPKISLPVFGLASYKFKASLWTPNGGSERQLVNFLTVAAEKCLSELHVDHPDFRFFSRR